VSISICVAAKGPCDPVPFLEALRAQGLVAGTDADIHIAHDADLADSGRLAAAGCRLHRCPEGTSILRLWGIAIAASTRPMVAILDIDCPPEPGWWHGVQRALRGGGRMFTGPIIPGWGPGQREIVGYLVDYAQFHPPSHPSVHEVPGINFICARALLDPPAMLAEQGLYKTFTLWRLKRTQGLAPARHDDVRVIYRRPFQPGRFLRRRYLHGRCFAGRRHEQPGQPPRIACVAACPALPLLKCWRIWRAAARHPALRAAFGRQLYWITLCELAWSWGELVGYVLGPGHACADLD
jgi:hypothetical protein